MNITPWREALQTVFLGNSLEMWIYAAFAALLTLGALPLAKRAALQRFATSLEAGRRWALPAALVQRTTALFFVALAVYLGTQNLTFSPRAERVIKIAVLIAVWFQVGLWVSALVVHVLKEQLIRRGAQHLALASGFTVVSFIAQVLVWLVAVALALANAGVNVIALITGLGAGGAAIALAARSWLSNLFANASISLDKVFAVGDSLVSGEFQGKVEQIGNRSTLLRSVNGELILIPNEDLLKSPLRNFDRIEERREVLTLQLARDTSAAKVREAIGLIARIIQAQPLARFDRCHFAQLNIEVLQLEAVYYVQNGTVAVLADVRDTIDALIHAAFADAHIHVEYPMQRFDLAVG